MMPNGGTFGGKHTYSYFGMIPKSKIIFAPPEPKISIIDMPNTNGELDYTEAMNDKVKYGNRKGSLTFLVLTSSDYPSTYSAVLTHFHGQEMNVVLDDDPLYYYKGRFSVNTWKSWEGRSEIVLDYNVEPYKYSLGSTGAEDWLWDDLFDNIIYYGTFDVDGSKERNLINPSGVELTPTISNSSAITIDFDGTTYSKSAGTSKNHGIVLQPGDNVMTFNGHCRVLVDYAKKKSL